jgi:hypothetical protein
VQAIVLPFDAIIYSKHFLLIMNKSNLKPAIKKQTIQELFKDLNNQDPNCCQCYTHWLKKDLTLEQSLELSLKGVTEYCYRLMQPISADWLVSYGQHLDCIEFVNKSEYPLHTKLKLLVEYSAELFEFALKYKNLNSSVEIRLSKAKVEKIAENNNLHFIV